MYNPDFWEVQVDPADLENLSSEAGLWFESSEDRENRYRWEDRANQFIRKLDALIDRSLTKKQREAAVLYFKYGKTQQEISELLGISRRVVSQHLFGITRNGRCVGGVVKKLQKLCRKRGIALSN